MLRRRTEARGNVFEEKRQAELELREVMSLARSGELIWSLVYSSSYENSKLK